METRPREIKYRDEEDEVALKPGSHRLLPKGESAATVTDFSTTSGNAGSKEESNVL